MKKFLPLIVTLLIIYVPLHGQDLTPEMPPLAFVEALAETHTDHTYMSEAEFRKQFFTADGRYVGQSYHVDADWVRRRNIYLSLRRSYRQDFGYRAYRSTTHKWFGTRPEIRIRPRD